MSKFFKQGTKVGIPDEAKSQPIPRSRDEINKQYQDVCTALGDKQVKSRGIQQEIDNLFKYVESLGNELAARDKMDSEAKSGAAQPSVDQNPTESAQDSLAPETAGVDVNG